MVLGCESNEELQKLHDKFNQRVKEERLAAANLTSETLSELKISIEALPQRCQNLLRECSKLQEELDIKQLDPVEMNLRHSQLVAQTMREEYQLLELRQKNAELQRKIERNQKFIDDLKRELQSSKDSLSHQNPNPDNIHDHIRQMKQKLCSYQEIHEKAKAKYAKLRVPEHILPKSLEELASRLASLEQEESSLKQRADDITLARRARDTLSKLRRV